MTQLNTSLILPKTYFGAPPGKNTYYLAGPIRGTDDWQAEAVVILANLDPGCTIVCPCRWDDTHPLSIYRVIPDNGVGGNLFELLTRQTQWERVWMSYAAAHGCLIFWLPCENTVGPRPKEDGPYARDTYGELGRYSNLVSSDQNCLKMSIGADPKLPESFGLSQIKCNLDIDFAYGYPIFDTLQKTLEVAVEYANS